MISLALLKQNKNEEALSELLETEVNIFLIIFYLYFKRLVKKEFMVNIVFK